MQEGGSADEGDFPPEHEERRVRVQREVRYKLRAIITGYESELDNILNNSNDIIKKYKQQLENLQKNTELEKQFKSYQDKTEMERNKSLNEFQKYQRSMEEREKTLFKDLEEKMLRQKTVVANMKGGGGFETEVRGADREFREELEGGGGDKEEA